MQGSIAQMIALVIYGNRFFQTGDANDLLSLNSKFKFCRSVTFVELRPSEKEPAESLYAQTPQEWYERLRTDGVHGLRFHLAVRISPERDRKLTAFAGGGGREVMETVHDADSDSDYWEGRWQRSKEKAPGNLIWDVTYAQIASHAPSMQDQAKAMQATINELGLLLQSLRIFAEQHDLPDFAKCFSNASDILSAPNPTANVNHAGIVPPGYLSHEAETLLHAAEAAWVFGGMGSWNDIGFDGADQKTYESLSGQLYLLLNSAIVQATNNSYR